MARKANPFASPAKARKVLAEETPTLQGKPISPAQRRALHEVAGREGPKTRLTRLRKDTRF